MIAGPPNSAVSKLQKRHVAKRTSLKANVNTNLLALPPTATVQGKMTVYQWILGALAISVLWVFAGAQTRQVPLPPGPRGLPIIGVRTVPFFMYLCSLSLLQNLADMPKQEEWVAFAEWGRKWGA